MRSRHVAFRLTLSMAALTVGCQTLPKPAPLLPPLPRGEAIRRVNDNADRITATLRAVGSADGRFADPDGVLRSFHLDAVLFYLKPSYLRLDLKSLGQRRVLVGSNLDAYWFYAAEEDTCLSGRHADPSDAPADMPVRADQMIEALGLGGIPSGTGGQSLPAMRVEDECVQLLFVNLDAADGPSLVKEYWLDRRPPFLIRRVIFRDVRGAVQMDAQLADYRGLDPAGPLLPFRITATWPDKRSEMTLRVSRWELVPQVNADGPQFRTPPQCLEP